MSGFEIAGIILGAIPLTISSLKYWRQTIKMGGFDGRVREQHRKCLREIEYCKLIYKEHLTELLLPVVDKLDDVLALVGDPDSQDWKSSHLESRLEARLQGSYSVFMQLIYDMNDAIQQLNMVLSLDHLNTRSAQKGKQPAGHFLTSAKAKLDHQKWILRFALNESERNELLAILHGCNERLGKLLSTRDKMVLLRNSDRATETRSTMHLEQVFHRTRKQAVSLFCALQKAWQCKCQQSHAAILRLEHRDSPSAWFEMILFYMRSPYSPLPKGARWSKKRVRCGRTDRCVEPQKRISSSAPIVQIASSVRRRRVRPEPLREPWIQRKALPAAAAPGASSNSHADEGPDEGPEMKLCHRLGSSKGDNCVGVVTYDSETFHLHPFPKGNHSAKDNPMTLDQVLSKDFESRPSRRQRYALGLRLASSVAQLQATPWMEHELRRDMILFLSNNDHLDSSLLDLFIQKDFSQGAGGMPEDTPSSDTFNLLAIILLELCFGQRLVDHPKRQQLLATSSDPQVVGMKIDLILAVHWAKDVNEEGGEEYARAVDWCFSAAKMTNHTWRSDIIKHVIAPLELCQEHFKATLDKKCNVWLEKNVSAASAAFTR